MRCYKITHQLLFVSKLVPRALHCDSNEQSIVSTLRSTPRFTRLHNFNMATANDLVEPLPQFSPFVMDFEFKLKTNEQRERVEGKFDFEGFKLAVELMGMFTIKAKQKDWFVNDNLHKSKFSSWRSFQHVLYDLFYESDVKLLVDSCCLYFLLLVPVENTLLLSRSRGLEFPCRPVVRKQ